ncbi:MAG: MAE_28990/MAE_18760 family HEPN-like nuclease, partial [Pontibacterium sp.]
KTITATAYLMIYNMVESTMTEAIDAVHQQLRQDNMTFSQLSEKLKEVCFKNFKSSIESTRERQNKGETFDSALVWLGYKKDNHWNGNIDARSIRTTAAKYGFNIAPTDYTATRHGESLLKVKTTRNKLAHGEVSFEECGQGTAIEELMEIHEQAVMYLSAVIDGIETYLDNKAYVAA